MQKSLFKKLFVMAMAVLLCAVIIMGVILFAFFRNFWINEKQSLLRSEITSVSLQLDQMQGTMNYEHQVRRILSAMSKTVGGDLFITDITGKIAYSSNTELEGKQISNAITSQTLTSEYNELGTLNSVLDKSSYVLADSLENMGHSTGFVFATIPSNGLTLYLIEIMQIFLISALIVAILVFAAVYMVSAKVVRPVREMAQAARCMSHGDFTKFIHIDREDEIGELAIAFNNMTRSLSAGEQMRRGFVANVSHELKTPMTTISGFIDGILDGTIGENDRERYLTIVTNEVKRLSRLVVSMLSLSKLEAGEMQISPSNVDLTQVIVDIAISFEQRINEKNIEMLGLEDLEPSYVIADLDLIHQAIYNLIDNAIKYTPNGGYIKFNIEKSGNKQIVSIRNSGNGIPEKELPHIFDRFYKVDKSRGTDRIGAGLGLFLVKTIISLHKGTITVNSIEGEYCEFVVSLNCDDSNESSKLI